MDTSKEYIDMCRKATEIQNPDRSIAGNYYELNGNLCISGYVRDWHFDELWLYTIPYGDMCKAYTRDELVWLPRQDQLQDMMLPANCNSADVSDTLYDFNVFVANHVDEFEYRSFEQLWIRYIMYCDHGKQWNGSEWV